MGMGAETLLRIYLNDHLAGSSFGARLARRISARGEPRAYAEALSGLASEIEEDREALREAMRDLGVRPNPFKVAGAVLAERLSALKTNRRLRGRSPLSPVLELEELTVGVRGKLALWLSLGQLAGREPRLDGERLAALAERAERQLETLKKAHEQAVREAFGEQAGAPDSA